MYLPDEIPDARVLVTVKTYPLPSSKYAELVCTAGLLEGEKWIRIYPVSASLLRDDRRLPKYSWVRMNLRRKTRDFRPESYSPVQGIDEPMVVESQLGPADAWAARRRYVEREVFESMSDVISLAHRRPPVSLATVRPREIIDLVIEPTEPDWRDEWLDQTKQGSMFAVDGSGRLQQRRLVRKLPYKFSYRFITEGDSLPRTMQIEDWEIGALYWNCLRSANGDAETAKRLVRRKHLDEMRDKCDLLFFVGTTMAHHWAPNPFVVIGVFYPPRTSQLRLLELD